MRSRIIGIGFDGLLGLSDGFGSALRFGVGFREPLDDHRRARIEFQRLLVEIHRAIGGFVAAGDFVFVLGGMAHREIEVGVGDATDFGLLRGSGARLRSGLFGFSRGGVIGRRAARQAADFARR